ncbi:hypothetical protein F5887DRAFT_988832, partial [Amanita rubescens]
MRILIAGRSGSGKSSLINAIFKETLAEVYHRESGPTDINKEYTSANDNRFIIHDSQGYDPGTTEIYDNLEKFITQRNASTGTEKLDAVWLCIPVPFAGGSIYNTWDEKIVQFNGGKVPIIVVFTKLDLLIARAKMTRSSLGQGEIIQESVEQNFREKQGPEFEQLSKSEERKISYTVVGFTLFDTVQRLVDFTIQTVESYEAPESVEY